MKNYITKRGHIFTPVANYTFNINHKEKTYEIRGPYMILAYPNRGSFDTALEMDLLESYVVEIFTKVWD